MAQDNPYEYIVVETYYPANTAGLHGPIHVRPVAGEKYSSSLHVECSKSLVRDYPVGTRFRLKCKLTDREGGGQFLYSYFGWRAEIIRRFSATPFAIFGHLLL
jgi:hypothetical protein